ncbi:MAG: NTP transferase domain-containing protein [Vulcanimicrobiaceae bacterium]
MIAVVLAGGPRDAIAALEPGAPNKAFVRVGGIELVQRVIAALRSVPAIERIVVVAPASAAAHPALAGADEVRADGPRISDSLRSGLRGFAPDRTALVATSDLPVLTRAAVEEFLAHVIARDPDLAYACLDRRYHLARFPEIPHTWAHLREGSFCGGGLVAIKPRALPDLERFLERLGAARKNPLQLAGIFGWDVLARYAVRRLSIGQAEARASALLRAPAIAVPCTQPEVAVNVDRPSDVALAERLAAGGR